MRRLEEDDGADCVYFPVIFELFDGSGGERAIVIGDTYQKS